MSVEEELRNIIFKASNLYSTYSPTLDSLRIKIINDKNYTMSMSKDLILTCSEQFFNKIPTEEDKIQLVLHEILHYMLNHFVRYANNYYKDIASFDMHNVAMDMEINQYLQNSSEWITKNGITPQSQGYSRGLSYEEYIHLLYRDVEQNKHKQSNSSGNNSIIDKLSNGESIVDLASADLLSISECSSDELNEIEESVQSIIEQCNQRNSSCGYGDSSIISTLKKIPPKKYAWNKILDNIIRSKLSDINYGFDYQTYRKYNRRLNPTSDIIFPSRYSEDRTLCIVVGIDISGSMGNLVDEMYARLKSLLSNVEYKVQATIVECDTKIRKIVDDFDFSKNEVDTSYGGGTDMNAIPIWVKEQVDNKKRLEPDVIIIMTDNYCCWSKDTPYLKKTYVLTDNISKDCPYKQFEVKIE